MRSKAHARRRSAVTIWHYCTIPELRRSTRNIARSTRSRLVWSLFSTEIPTDQPTLFLEQDERSYPPSSVQSPLLLFSRIIDYSIFAWKTWPKTRSEETNLSRCEPPAVRVNRAYIWINDKRRWGCLWCSVASGKFALADKSFNHWSSILSPRVELPSSSCI